MISFKVLFFTSIVSGFVGSMCGMGGGVVLIPVLTFLGLNIKKAIALSMVSVIATSSGSAAAYVRDRLTNLKVGMFLEVFTIFGALTGASLAVVTAQKWLYILFGFVLLLSWLALFITRNKEWQPIVTQDPLSQWLELEGSYFDKAISKTVQYQAKNAGFGAPLMFVAGLVAGLLGIGAGALKVLIHDLVMGLPPKVSTTTSNLIIGVTALAGASVYLAKGLIDPGLAGPVILGVLIGAFVGTRVLVRLKNEVVRNFFLLILAVLAVEMILRGLKGAS